MKTKTERIALITGGILGLGLQIARELGGSGADLDIADRGKTSAWFAMLSGDGPTEGYFPLGEPMP